MKIVPKYYIKNEDKVLAIQDKDFQDNKDIFRQAEKMWYQEWRDSSALDEGSCCGGKGISTYYVGPRKRTAEQVNVVRCDFIQGNVSASRSAKKVLEYLKNELPEFEFSYNDGWMD